MWICTSTTCGTTLRLLRRFWRGMTQAVKAGKARYIGISNCFAWQLCQGQRPGGKGGICKICFDSGALQPDFPGGRAGDDPLLSGGAHRRDPLQSAGGGPPFQKTGADHPSAGAGCLRPPEIRRDPRKPTGRSLPGWRKLPKSAGYPWRRFPWHGCWKRARSR